MQKYETIFVIDSLLKSYEIEAVITKYEKFISANGGQIDTIERWGKKRLAYEIKKRQYGYYVLIRFDGPGAIVKQLEREYRLNESILRYMTLRLNKQALKMLEKQKSSALAASREATDETAEKKPQDKAVSSEDDSDSDEKTKVSEVAEESSEQAAEKNAEESKPEDEKKVEAEPVVAEETSPSSAEAVEDTTKTE